MAFSFTPELVKQSLSGPKLDLVMEGKEKREQHTGDQQFHVTDVISHVSFTTKEGHPIKPDANEAMK